MEVLRLSCLTFASYGLHVHVESDDCNLLTSVVGVLPPGAEICPHDVVSPRFGVFSDGTITCDGATVAGPMEAERLLSELEILLRHHVAEHAPDYVFVHAGVVALGAAGIVIPGRSGSGKSTLVTELVERGATYYSDEYAVAGPDGMIRPFAKPISLRESAGVRRMHAPSADQIACTPVRATLIVFTEYRRGSVTRLGSLGAGQGAMALLEQTVPARKRPAAALATAAALASGAAIVAGARGEAAEAAQTILRLAWWQRPDAGLRDASDQSRWVTRRTARP